ncbi:CLUMA_CG010583, isoform A [Clunio marinus]|uniref:CLUMA_CG010583, isoform A n=1 Tax=Clunio marinus TaxID=568069 RepID=A0A1J1IBR6_9DIPT|nr:CLUMA_CG010583, isoform A [Clunio marinus]
MMFLHLIILGLICVTEISAVAEDTLKEIFLSMINDCQIQEKGTRDDSVSVLAGKIETPEAKCLVTCIYETLGILSKGVVKKPSFMQAGKMIFKGDPEKMKIVSKTVDTCKSIAGERCQQGANFHKCVVDTYAANGVMLDMRVVQLFILSAICLYKVSAVSQDNVKEIFMSMLTDCKVQENGTDDDMAGVLVVNFKAPTVKCMVACMYESFGILKKGTFKKNAFMQGSKTIFQGDPEKMRISAIVADKCNGISGERCEQATNLFLCVHNSYSANGVNLAEYVV